MKYLIAILMLSLPTMAIGDDGLKCGWIHNYQPDGAHFSTPDGEFTLMKRDFMSKGINKLPRVGNHEHVCACVLGVYNYNDESVDEIWLSQEIEYDLCLGDDSFD